MNNDLIEALHTKLQQLQRMRDHLTYSDRKITGWWRV